MTPNSKSEDTLNKPWTETVCRVTHGSWVTTGIRGVASDCKAMVKKGLGMGPLCYPFRGDRDLAFSIPVILNFSNAVTF